MLSLNTTEKKDVLLFSDLNSDFKGKYNPKLIPKVISLIDMDAFFAQVCHIEYNIPREKPLAVIHNNLVLALNYPSKEKGLTRGMNKDQILSICPEIIIPENIFVDTLSANKGCETEYSASKNCDFDLNLHLENGKDEIKEGSIGLEEGGQDKENKKLLLDIFRKASKLIFKSLTSYLPYCKFQISSIDEIYFDITELVIKIFDVYIDIENESESTECVRKLSELNKFLCVSSEYSIDESDVKELKKKNELIDYIRVLFPELFNKSEFGNIVYELYDYNDNIAINNEYCDNNYFGITNLTFKEMCLIIGSTLIYRARKRLLSETTYTCSSGIYVNKLYSKMVSSLRKPNNQVLLLPRWFDRFISETNILKLRYLGGKLGKRVTELLPKVNKIKDLQRYTVLQLIDLFGNKNGTYLYNSSRGIDNDSVSNNKVNSMQSSKVFGIPLKSISDVERWLMVFSNELYNRNYSNYKQFKSKPTKIGVKLKDANRVVKIKTSDFKYKSEIPTVKDIYDCSRHILYTKFNNNDSDLFIGNKKPPKDAKFLLPCKYLGISLSGYVKIINNKKISFEFVSDIGSIIKNTNNAQVNNSVALNSRSDIKVENCDNKCRLFCALNQDTEYMDTDLILMKELESQETQDKCEYLTTREDLSSDTPVTSNDIPSRNSKVKRIYNDWPFEYQYSKRNSTLFKAKKKSINLSMKRISSLGRKLDLMSIIKSPNSQSGKTYIQTKLPQIDYSRVQREKDVHVHGLVDHL
ncbi:hypothetical protein FG386_000622 [Cryptosporidium ryanae]|uniref:uncharacterized protein n=1 Tax=Cryptosporidium ryanae TaxID=515981 RepID=UPI003519F578|nr:hypothetical protein FG386_000622 [Cryptosporidium ryanae]